jgi:hypothetical protein
MMKTTTKRGLLEFQSHGNRVWHRCWKVHEAWSKPGVEEPVQAGAYVMIFEDVCDLDGTLNPESLAKNSLAPMYKIGAEHCDRDHPFSFGVIPSYFCPACLRLYTEEEIQSGRTVDLGARRGRKTK